MNFSNSVFVSAFVLVLSSSSYNNISLVIIILNSLDFR